MLVGGWRVFVVTGLLALGWGDASAQDAATSTQLKIHTLKDGPHATLYEVRFKRVPWDEARSYLERLVRTSPHLEIVEIDLRRRRFGQFRWGSDYRGTVRLLARKTPFPITASAYFLRPAHRLAGDVLSAIERSMSPATHLVRRIQIRSGLEGCACRIEATVESQQSVNQLGRTLHAEWEADVRHFAATATDGGRYSVEVVVREGSDRK